MPALLLCLASAPAHALQVSTGDDANLSWDTSLLQTEAFRVVPADPALLRDPNSDDGDRHFTPGLVSSRTDLFSELDYSSRTFGARLSAAGWYDPIYLHGNADNPADSFNPVSVPPGSFPKSVRNLQGLQGEILDAFVHAKLRLAGVPVTLRVGRHTLIWGESLFFGGNGIASGQAPTDGIRASLTPDATAKELYLPVAQLSGSIQLRPGLSVEFYEQLEWRRDRVPGVESYFSTADILDAGGERILLGGGRALTRTADARPGALPQFGLALRGTAGQSDWGIYAIQADARAPQIVTDIGAGHYHLAYPGHIGIYGASLSTFLGDNALSGEISWHHGVPVSPPGGMLAEGDGKLPRADSLNAQVSLVSQLAPGRLWNAADCSAEIAANTVLGASPDADTQSSPGRTTVAAELQFVPHYFHVLPAIDLSPSVTLGYGIAGSTSIDPEMQQGNGALTVGINADYRAVWHARLQFTHFIGPPSTQKQADRDFATISLLRGF